MQQRILNWCRSSQIWPAQSNSRRKFLVEFACAVFVIENHVNLHRVILLCCQVKADNRRQLRQFVFKVDKDRVYESAPQRDHCFAEIWRPRTQSRVKKTPTKFATRGLEAQANPGSNCVWNFFSQSKAATHDGYPTSWLSLLNLDIFAEIKAFFVS